MDKITALTNNLTQAQLIAADPSTQPEILQELALFTDQKTRQAVASNPNTPPDVLLKLGAEFPSEFLSNPVFPLLLLENPNLVAEIPLPTLRSILRLENVPIYILEQAAEKADLEVQLALVKNVQTSKGVLNRLAQSRHSQVVDAARLHITYAGELTQKYEEKITQVIQGIIATSKVHTTSFTVLAQICPIPEFIVEYWVKDSHYRDHLCRKIAYSTATFPSILQQLAYHADGYTKVGAVQNPNTPVETLRQLAREQDLGLLKIVTRNPNIPSDVLESLSQNPDQTVRIQVAQHPNTPLAVVKELVNDTDMHVANAATEVIREKQGEYTTQTVRKNPKTPAHVLEKLLQKDPRTVCEHPNTPPEILLEFSQSVHREMRECVARNPNAPVSILENLADDESSNVRWKVARNPHTPSRLLFKQLARDARVNDAIAYQMSTKKNGQYPEKDSILDILAEESTSPLETILQRLAQDGGEAARIFLARRIRTLKGYSSGILTQAHSPDGQLTARSAPDVDGQIELLDRQTGKRICLLTGHEAAVQSLAFSPDSQTLASKSAEDFKLWRVGIKKETYSCLRSQRENYPTIMFTQANHQSNPGLISSDFYASFQERRAAPGEIDPERWNFGGGRWSFGSDVTLSADGKVLARCYYKQPVQLWNLQTGEDNGVVNLDGDYGFPLALNSTGSMLAATGKGEIALWDVTTNKMIYRFTHDSNWIKQIVFSPDDRMLASGADDKTIKLWDLQTNCEIKTLQDYSSIQALAFSPLEPILASVNRDSTIRLWDLQTMEEIHSFKSDQQEVINLKFSPDGKFLGSSNKKSIRVWQLRRTSQS